MTTLESEQTSSPSPAMSHTPSIQHRQQEQDPTFKVEHGDGHYPPSLEANHPSALAHGGSQLADADVFRDDAEHPLAQLGQTRKNFLLFIFSIASFVDIANVSGVGIAVARISADIDLATSQIIWIITSYSICFSAILLFAGRLSDLFPAQIIFEAGFVALGVISLANSFVTSNKYGFLVLRGLGGIAGAMTIPSAFHLLVHMFPEPQEQQKKLALLSLAGGIGNVLGLVLAGLCMLADYRWYFRLIAIICLSFSLVTFFLLPYTGSSYSSSGESTPRWKRMDIPGVIIMMAALICFILALTQGPIDGWGSASFIAPFVLSIPLGVGFFVWEARIPPRTAALPSSVWSISNVIIDSLALFIPMSYWMTSQLLYSTYWQEVSHWAPLHVAAALLPQGIICLLAGAVSQFVPQIITKPRITISASSILIVAALLLQIYSEGGDDGHYWRFAFPAFLIGSFASMCAFFASAINLITYCPPEMAGVAGAWTAVIEQVSGSIALAVQSGFEGNKLVPWKETGAKGYWFMIAWTIVLAVQFVVFYKQPKSPEEEHIAARQRILERNGEIGV